MNETIRRETRVVAQASFLEGGLRVPLIVRWPARVPAGRVDKTTLSSGFDWLPTVLEIAGEIHARLRRDSDEIAYPTRRRRRLAPSRRARAGRAPPPRRSERRARVDELRCRRGGRRYAWRDLLGLCEERALVCQERADMPCTVHPNLLCLVDRRLALLRMPPGTR